MRYAASRFGDDPPFLSADPPRWAARSLASLLLLLFVVGVVAAAIVQVPETVDARFVLVPRRGADPIRALRRGQVIAVRLEEGATAAAGAPLVVIRSDPVGDRAAELETLRAQIAGTDSALRNAMSEYESQRRADEEEGRALAAARTTLTRTIELKRGQHQIASERASRYQRGIERGTVSLDEYTAVQLDVARLAAELSTAEGDHEQTESHIVKLHHENDARAAQYHETVRTLEQTRAQARIRAAAIGRELANSTGADFVVAAPCSGTVLRLRVKSAGAVVQEGDVVGEIACSQDKLQAELALPPAGVGRVLAGQPVKLLYDAFPYQRFGIRHGRIRWLSPAAGAIAGDTTGFRAVIDLDGGAVRVDGQSRPLLAGMTGRARVVVDRRSLISYAFAPIRQLRESMAGGDQ